MTDNAEWWIEGSAEYMGHYIMDTTPNLEYHGVQGVKKRPVDPGQEIANPDTWNDDTLVNYYYGSQIVYMMDLAIREGSNGEASIIDYVQTLNEHEGKVSHDDMMKYLEDYGAGEYVPIIEGYIYEESSFMSLGEEVHEHGIMDDVVGNQFTNTVELPPKHEHTPAFTVRDCQIFVGGKTLVLQAHTKATSPSRLVPCGHVSVGGR
jgi:hypothetical protein